MSGSQCATLSETVNLLRFNLFVLQGEPGSGISVVSPYRMNPGYRRPRPAPGTDSDHGYSTMTPYGDQVRMRCQYFYLATVLRIRIRIVLVSWTRIWIYIATLKRLPGR